MNPDVRSSLHAFSLAVSIAGAASGCGGNAPAAEAPAAPAATVAKVSAPAVADPAAPAPESEPAAPAPAPAPESDAASTPAPAPEPQGGKNITYRMTAMGLVADVDGVQLEPRAEPIKLAGGWGVKLVVRAKALDEREHHLESPSLGPLMVAEEIDRGGKAERVADQRDGDGELTLDKTSTPMSREMKKPIVAGQSLTLYVGLWGLGTSAADRKPIKKLFVVKMVAGSHKPQPVVSAPE